MALADILQLSEERVKPIELTEEWVQDHLPQLRKMIAKFREYPDLFIDFIKGDDCTFQFYFFQRIFLRCVMRHRFVYATFPRAYSKSFLSMMALILRAILYPGSHLFVTTGGKFTIIIIYIQ